MSYLTVLVLLKRERTVSPF